MLQRAAAANPNFHIVGEEPTRGVKAAGDLRVVSPFESNSATQPFVCVPLSTTVRCSEICTQIDEHGYRSSEMHEFMVLSIWLVLETRRPSAAWSSFIDSLPRRFHSCEWFCDRVLHQIPCLSLRNLCTARRAIVRSEWLKLRRMLDPSFSDSSCLPGPLPLCSCDCCHQSVQLTPGSTQPITLSEYQWAYATVATRSLFCNLNNSHLRHAPAQLRVALQSLARYQTPPALHSSTSSLSLSLSQPTSSSSQLHSIESSSSSSCAEHEPIPLTVSPEFTEEIRAWTCAPASTSSLCLAPFVDMLNHSPLVSTQAICGNDSNGIMCFALFQSANLQQGDDILISYGSLSSVSLGIF